LASAEQEASELREKIAANQQREMQHEHEKAETERQFSEAKQQWQGKEATFENMVSQLREKIATQEAQQIASLNPHAQAALKDHRVKLQRAEDLVVTLREKIVLQDQQQYCDFVVRVTVNRRRLHILQTTSRQDLFSHYHNVCFASLHLLMIAWLTAAITKGGAAQ
jgi:signal recognition particle GTPase